MPPEKEPADPQHKETPISLSRASWGHSSASSTAPRILPAPHRPPSSSSRPPGAQGPDRDAISPSQPHRGRVEEDEDLSPPPEHPQEEEGPAALLPHLAACWDAASSGGAIPESLPAPPTPLSFQRLVPQPRVHGPHPSTPSQDVVRESQGARRTPRAWLARPLLTGHVPEPSPALLPCSGHAAGAPCPSGSEGPKAERGAPRQAAVSPANLLRAIPSIPSSKQLMKILTRMGPTTGQTPLPTSWISPPLSGPGHLASF